MAGTGKGPLLSLPGVISRQEAASQPHGGVGWLLRGSREHVAAAGTGMRAGGICRARASTRALDLAPSARTARSGRLCRHHSQTAAMTALAAEPAANDPIRTAAKVTG